MALALEVGADLAVLALAVALGMVLTARLRGTRLWFPLTVFFGAVSVFAGSDAAAHLAEAWGDLELKGQFLRASYIGIGLSIPAMVHVAFAYPRPLRHGLLSQGVAATYVVGVLFSVLTPTKILFEALGSHSGGTGNVYGPLFWPLQGVLVAALFPAIGWQAFLALRGRPEERRPAAALALSIALPFAIGGSAVAAGLPSVGGLDVVTLSFGLEITMLAWVVYTGRFAPSAQATFHAIVESIDEAIVIVDSRGQPVSLNPRSRQILGVPEGSTDVPELPALLEHAGVSREKAELMHRAGLAVLRGRQEAYSGVLEGVGPMKRTCTVRVLPLGRRDTKDEAEAALVMLRDETDRRALEAATTRSRDVLDLVIRMLGHDLKAPLTVVQGDIDLGRMRLSAAESSAQVQAVRADLEKMSQAIVGMQLMMGNARALSRLAAVGDGGPGLVEIDLTRLVRQAADLLRPTAEAKQVRLEMALLEGVWVKAAPGFDSVPRNLVDNAVKYTPPGGTVTASLAAVDGRAVLTVADTGEGIPPERADLLFRAFERLGAEKGAQEGHGLGLAIVAKLVEISGGKVRVENRTDGKAGAVFRVEVSLGKPPA